MYRPARRLQLHGNSPPQSEPWEVEVVLTEIAFLDPSQRNENSPGLRAADCHLGGLGVRKSHENLVGTLVLPSGVPQRTELLELGPSNEKELLFRRHVPS